MVVNGGMPGPLIEANWGDTVVVKVTNNLSSPNGTSIHFHGVRQLNNAMNDGVPSITQCPIAPGSSMTYTWIAEQYGTSWWHSHFALQTWEGVFGPMIIHGPSTTGYDEDLGTLIVQDWTHRTVDSMYELAENATANPAGPPGATFGGPQTMDTGLLNGKNIWIPPTTNSTNSTSSTNSTAPSGSRTEFKGMVPGLKYRLRIINAAIQSTYKVYIDNHSFQVIQTDFVPIVPYTTSILNINIGMSSCNPLI
jgi:FtsP/CotA-like multicopper oxidase with cupredoxin domain